MFKLENTELARRLDELRGADVTDLSDEIALARLLTEVAVNRGQVGLAGQLLHTTAKLELAAVVQREKLNHLLDSSAPFAAGTSICQALVEAVRVSQLPGNLRCRNSGDRVGNCDRGPRTTAYHT